MFSARVPTDLSQNDLSRKIAQLRSRGVRLLDLTESNPTNVGLDYPPELLEPLAAPECLRYEPRPFGLREAREAVARLYGTGSIPAGRVILTASTSEAYSFLFKLLCAPGDEVLVPVPSYPLFDYLTRLDAVSPRSYNLDYHGTWFIDLPSLERGLNDRTRAILIVSPNNPTGSLVRRSDLEAVSGLAAERSIALIGDEVFSDYLLQPAADGCSILSQDSALTFCLGGLSKSVGLPQLKLAWMVAAGPPELVHEALDRLEVICDSYLSVSTPVQHAAGRLLAAGKPVRAAIADRLGKNLDWLGRATDGSACSVLRVEGGWSAVLHVPATRPEEQLVVDLLEQDEVIVHPGYFFDFPREAYLVVSLLTPPDAFREGASRLIARAGRL
jgi:aspartate/methionine/tyrosine aminotransferase